jgi:hypothetical protein
MYLRALLAGVISGGQDFASATIFFREQPFTENIPMPLIPM